MWESLDGVSPEIDPAAWVHPSAVLIGSVRIGPRASVWPHATLRGDDGAIVIGADSSVQDGTVIHTTEGLSESIVGDRVTVGHNVTLHGAIIGDDCIIGMGSVLLDNARIGHHSIVGAGALVTQRKVFPARSLILGSPAKVVRELSDDELAEIDSSWRHYVRLIERYRGQP